MITFTEKEFFALIALGAFALLTIIIVVALKEHGKTKRVEKLIDESPPDTKNKIIEKQLEKDLFDEDDKTSKKTADIINLVDKIRK